MAGYSRPAVARIFGVPALGGLLFGWDIGATSYVLTQLQSAEYSGVSWSGAVAGSSFLQGLITSGGVAGALIGAMIVFRIADAIGRRRELILAALLYIAGGVLEVASGSGTSEASGLALLLRSLQSVGPRDNGVEVHDADALCLLGSGGNSGDRRGCSLRRGFASTSTVRHLSSCRGATPASVPQKPRDLAPFRRRPAAQAPRRRPGDRGGGA